MAKEKDKLKNYSNSQKQVHNQEIIENINEAYGSSYEYKKKIDEYNKNKRMKLIHWIITLGIIIFGTGMAFLVGFLTKDSFKAPNYQGTGWFALAYMLSLFLTFWIIGLIKNREAAKFFNDRRRRYQKTLTTDEARLIVWQKITFISFFIMLILTIITNIIF